MNHTLKTLSEYYQEIINGRKTFEIRKDDRPFRIGDILTLVEINNDLSKTGRECLVEITYIIRGKFGLQKEYCVMAIRKIKYWSKEA